MLRKLPVKCFSKRNFCKAAAPNYVIEQLNERSLITVVGEEAPIYLQGLITNDISHLVNNYSSLYTLFLNSKGRILYDSIIYKMSPNEYFVECDSSLANSLQKHLEMFKLRRKIDIHLNNHRINVLFDKHYCNKILENKLQVDGTIPNFNIDFSALENTSLKIFKDPRVPQLGYRIISHEETDLQSELFGIFDEQIDKKNSSSYRKLRYSLGIGEGSVDLPSGECFPLESNGDYLHGISFHKGCYVGQELTARTYHTGVTRKRIMPLYFHEISTDIQSEDLVNEDNRKLGKLRGLEDNVGLGLVRLELLKSNSKILVGGTEAVVGKPFWWPIEAPKKKRA